MEWIKRIARTLRRLPSLARNVSDAGGVIVNFYKHYIGDFQRDTGHLSLTERGAYLALIHHYYATETPLPNNIDALCRIAGAVTKIEREAVKSSIQFFTLCDSGLMHNRIEAELEKAGEISNTNRDIALAREAKRRAQREERSKHEQSTNRATNVPRKEHEQSTNQTPDTRQEEPNGSSHTVENANSAPTKTASRFDEFWQAYPAKVGKKPSLAIWKSKRLDDKADELIADIQLRAGSDRKWLGGFIPNPATYLGQERWTDAIDRAQTNGSPRTAGNAAAIAEARRRVMGTNDQVVGVTS